MTTITMFRAKVKPENAAEAEAATKAMFAAVNEVQPKGVTYLSTKLSDGVTFVGFLALDGEDNPLPAIPEWVEFQQKLAAWRDGDPVVEPLALVGSYNLL